MPHLSPDSWASPVDPPPPRTHGAKLATPTTPRVPETVQAASRTLPLQRLPAGGSASEGHSRGELAGPADLYLLPLYRTRYTRLSVEALASP